MKYLIAITLCLIISNSNIAQSFNANKNEYPKGYFRYPLDIPPRLNANFGEMRLNHFHMGLDLFTLRKENLAVYAAADGYISRIKIEPGGFGNAIYINHPNGLTTLYAHMNDFMPPLQLYIKQLQYKSESWLQDLELQPEAFPVKKGDFIGYSGNTGGSMGPHVHFEIRETTTEKCLNGLLFGFNIPDNVPPVIYKIAIYNRDQSVYEQTPIIATAIRSTDGYRAIVPKLKFSRILIALQATDQMSGVANNNGIYKAGLFEGSNSLAGFTIDRVGYDQTRYLNAHIDYKTKMSGGPYIQFLMPLEGDELQIYPLNAPGSFLELKDTTAHNYRLEVQDPYRNISNLYFTLQKDPDINVNPPRSNNLMRQGEINVFENEEVEMYLPENALYDSIFFRYYVFPDGQINSYSPICSLHMAQVPLHDYCTIRIKPNKTIPTNFRDRMLMRKISNGSSEVQKANWEMGKYVAKFREFGTFQLVADNQPPTFAGLQENANLSKSVKMVISVRDNYNDINNFRAELDGKWLRFVQRGNSFTYVFDEKCLPGVHELKVSVNDEAGNITTRTYKFKR
jgi:murein DD-endopeptidase MepM/ murein hydrolase activator NlpD